MTVRQKRELAALAAMPDDAIDTSDIPELPLAAWKEAVRGRFYRPVKRAVSLRLDADVIARLKTGQRIPDTRQSNPPPAHDRRPARIKRLRFQPFENREGTSR